MLSQKTHNLASQNRLRLFSGRHIARSISLSTIAASAYLSTATSMILRQHWRNKMPEFRWVKARLDERLLMLSCFLFLINILILGVLYSSLKLSAASIQDPLVKGGFIFITGSFIVFGALRSYLNTCKTTGNALQATVYLRMLSALPVAGIFAILLLTFCSFYASTFSYSPVLINARDFLVHFIYFVCPEGSACTEDFAAYISHTTTVYHFWNPSDRLEELLGVAAVARQYGASMANIKELFTEHLLLFHYVLSHMSFFTFLSNFCALIIPLPRTVDADFTYGLSGLPIGVYLLRGWLDYKTVLSSDEDAVLASDVFENANEVLAFINSTAIFYLDNNVSSSGGLIFASMLTLTARYIICCAVMYCILGAHRKQYGKYFEQLQKELFKVRQPHLSAVLNKSCAVVSSSAGLIAITTVSRIETGLLCISPDMVGVVATVDKEEAGIKLLYGAVEKGDLIALTGAQVEPSSQLFFDCSFGQVVDVEGVFLTLADVECRPLGALLLIGNSGIAYVSLKSWPMSKAVLLSGSARRGQKVSACGARINISEATLPRWL